MSTDVAGSGERAAPRRSRRRLLSAMGVGGLTVVGTQLSATPASASHGPGDDVTALHLGQNNVVPAGAATGVQMDVENEGMVLHNVSTGAEASAMRVKSSGGKPALTAETDAADTGGAGVVGASSGSGFGEAGQFGTGSGTGVRGVSGSGTGVHGLSESGTGGFFESGTGLALQVSGPGHVRADHDNFAFVAENYDVSAGAGGLLAVSHGGKPAVSGEAVATEAHPRAGVQGVSSLPPFGSHFGDGPGVGVEGISGTGIGVQGRSTSGIGVEAIGESGQALVVRGPAAFATAGSATLPRGANSVTISNPAVTDRSHITVTLTGDPGPRQVKWVQRTPGSGFTLHLTAAPPLARPQTPFTYLILDPT